MPAPRRPRPEVPAPRRLVFASMLIALLAVACGAPSGEDAAEAPAEGGESAVQTEVQAQAQGPEMPGETSVDTSAGEAEGEGAIFASATDALAAGGFDVYVFYLHGRIIEEAGRRPEHPDYGVYEYDQVLRALAVPGVAVISEARTSGTEPAAYAAEVVAQIQELLAAGVGPSAITVIGFSKGGGIALRVSHQLAHDDVGFVILAACGAWLEEQGLEPRGRMLSIFESSDSVGSCRPWLDVSTLFFHEIEVSIGGSHGAFYRPDPAWVDQVLAWTGAPSVVQEMTQPERL